MKMQFANTDWEEKMKGTSCNDTWIFFSDWVQESCWQTCIYEEDKNKQETLVDESRGIKANQKGCEEKASTLHAIQNNTEVQRLSI